MIEYGLLFGLGFLTAAFLVMLLAPAIQRRVVVFTENRIKETMPLSPQEVRAQKDMARAAFAAEQSRTVQELTQERERRVLLQVAHEELNGQANRLTAENGELKAQVEQMSVEAADMRSALRNGENRTEQLQIKIAELEQAISERETEMENLNKQINRLATDRDNLKIDLAARNAQHESERYRMQTLREERDTLRREVRLLTVRAKEAEQRLEQEEHKALRLSDRLSREQATIADREALVERRSQEVARLRDKIKTLTTETREARKLARNAAPDRKAGRKATSEPVGDDLEGGLVPEEIPALKDELRHQSAALAERLVKSRSTTHDSALRDELASVAARMVAITAVEEGKTSPIHGILHAAAPDTGPHPSLADRIRSLIPDEPKPA